MELWKALAISLHKVPNMSKCCEICWIVQTQIKFSNYKENLLYFLIHIPVAPSTQLLPTPSRVTSLEKPWVTIGYRKKIEIDYVLFMTTCCPLRNPDPKLFLRLQLKEFSDGSICWHSLRSSLSKSTQSGISFNKGISIWISSFDLCN